ncbi:hypothetical protein FGG08_002614 [Glutinoglossum americanum]|uniref:LisH domain-containing protein n=1 Tax=Glutinoglossum americanum TaxID=1670608 RepID=A0A9P8ICI3_9PEZI|nr:hypothetical protein FGG08_002614 [Glutinoglossum americanum]
MAGMSSVGGPVGGIPMMNNGTGGQRDDNSHNNDMFTASTQLNTYIYDYFLKNGLYSCAKSLLNSNVALKTVSDGSNQRTSPNMRRDEHGNVLGNGVDENAMDASDTKDGVNAKRPDDLPDAKVPQDCPSNSFLFDWWCVFWEMFGAQQRRGNRNGEGTAMAYMQHTQVFLSHIVVFIPACLPNFGKAQQRIRQEQQRYMLGHQNPPMMTGAMNQYQNQMMMRNMQNGMNMGQTDMARTAMQNSRKSTPQQIQLAQKHQMMQQQMNRGEGAGMDMNGPRPQSPSSAENAPSPSKRPRLEGGQFNGQTMVPNGRAQPQMQGQQVNAASAQQAHNLLIANGINPNQLTASQFNSFQQQNPDVQAKSIQVYAQNLAQHQRSALQSQTMPKGIPNPGGVPNHGSPMMQQGSESGQNLGPVLNEFYAGNGASRSGISGGTGGNHALQDYQMQLMLLEQQNKKRLLMARQEHDSLARTDQPGVGQPGFQGMSPQGSRAGPSPNPSDQMKRGTPKLNQPGLPGSPMPDGSMPQAQQRNSPAAMGFGQSQMASDMSQGFYQQMKSLSDNVPNGNVMRPPSSHPPNFNPQINSQQLEQMSMAQQRRINGGWQGQSQPGQAQMMAQHPQGPQNQQMGTPGQRTTMPPPQAPPAGNNNGRTQPSSPQQNQAPPTPQQSTKANPKSKKEGKEPRKPARAKKGSTANLNSAATPSSEPDPPPTPTPSTPITPQHPSSFTGQKGSNGPNQAPANGQPAATAPAPAATLAPPQPDSNQVPTFPIDTADTQFNMEFLESGDVLDQFDFDSFLNTDDNPSGPFVFDTGALAYPQDGVEAGTGE